MTEAWQVRESQQQGHVRKLLQEVFDAEEEIEDGSSMILFETAINILEYLQGHVEYAPSTPALKLFFGGILPQCKAFARVESEKDYLLYLLFKEMQPSLFSRVAGVYQQDCTTNPLQAYGFRAMVDLYND